MTSARRWLSAIGKKLPQSPTPTVRFSSAAAVVNYCFTKATTEGRYDLGVLRPKLTALKEFEAPVMVAVRPVVAAAHPLAASAASEDEGEEMSDDDDDELAIRMMSLR